MPGPRQIAPLFVVFAIVCDGAPLRSSSATLSSSLGLRRLRGGGWAASEGMATMGRGWIERKLIPVETEAFTGAFEIFCDEIATLGAMPLEESAGMLEGLMQGIEGACNDCIETYRRPLRAGDDTVLPGGARGLFIVIQGLGEADLRHVSSMVCSILSSCSTIKPASGGVGGSDGVAAASINATWIHTTAGDDPSSCLSRLTTTIANVTMIRFPMSTLTHLSSSLFSTQYPGKALPANSSTRARPPNP